MNTRRKTRQKMAEKVQLHKTRRSTDVRNDKDARTSKLLLGECPPFVDKAFWVNDSFEKKVYMVGGIRDKNHIPTSDLYCLDVADMKWTNVTDSLRYRDIDSPFSAESCISGFKRIPRLSLPGCALFRVHRTSFLVLFGGYDDDLEQPSSRLIIIDPRRLEWWYQPVKSGIVAARIDPTVVAINRKLYIFGGFRRFSNSNDGGPHTSYSVASLSDDGRTWSWEVSDVPYPEDVPKGTIFSEATAVYGGAKILLTPWRTTKGIRIDFEEKNIFCFHIARREFQFAYVGGDFPKSLAWYFTFPMPPTSASEVSKPPADASALTSVIICGWVDWVDHTFIPEVWHMELKSPIEHISKLDVAPIVDQLDSQFDSDFRTAVMVDDRLFLLGSRPEGTVAEDKLVYNAYFEVPIRRLCADKL